jgi:predicted ATPase
MLLARLSATEKQQWGDIKAALANYGKEAGLFEDINIKRLGEKEASPFQVTIRLPGQRFDANLVDVGYGVSQVLPILVDCLTETKPAFFLMQQPEVHLHPRAQAELGNFVVRLWKSRGHRFVIETHSDYLVDRVRMEVRNGTVPPQEVSLLFLERFGASGTIHAVGLTTDGRPVDQPDSYRAFFLEEELRLLTGSDVPDS